MYLGLDIGTSAIKGLLLDETMGFVATSASSLEVLRRHEGWSEQEPASWLAAIDDVMAELAKKAPEAVSQIVSIGLSGQMHGLVALDKNDDVLRSAILWNDVRNGAEAEEMDKQNPDFRVIGGNAVMPGFTAPKAVWMARHEPELFAQISTILLPKDYVRFCLSGEKFTDMADCSGTLWLNVGTRDYSEALLSACGLSRSKMPKLTEGTQEAGRLTADLAQKWGIKGAPVIAGTGDNAAAACGLGMVSPGDGFLSLGTSGVVFVVTEKFTPSAQNGVHAFCHALPDTWHQMGVILSATDSLNWLSEVTGKDVGTLAQEAAGCPQASDVSSAQLLFHPYLSGERTPHNDANARGGFFNLSRSHDTGDMAFAVLEGVGFALADCVDVLSQSGSKLSSLMATGGGVKNNQWLQMIADITNCEITLPVDGDFGAALGAARLGAIASRHKGLETLTKPDIAARFAPNASRHGHYQQRRARWQRIYELIKEAR